MESGDRKEEIAGAGWIEVQRLKKGEATDKAPSCEEEVTLEASPQTSPALPAQRVTILKFVVPARGRVHGREDR
jgi:hypothetical protein